MGEEREGRGTVSIQSPPPSLLSSHPDLTPWSGPRFRSGTPDGTHILGVLVLGPGNHWLHVPSLQMEKLRPREGK